MYKLPKISIPVVLFVGTVACRGPLPCDDCDADLPAEEEAGDPLPDLPCGGADLMTDSYNCGSCGNECELWYEDAPWEAGSCQGGECGPIWSECTNGEPLSNNCEKICNNYTMTCVPGGCSGLTAMLFDIQPLDGVCYLHNGPHLTMTGACTEPIPWMTTTDTTRFAMCCCEQ